MNIYTLPPAIGGSRSSSLRTNPDRPRNPLRIACDAIELSVVCAYKKYFIEGVKLTILSPMVFWSPFPKEWGLQYDGLADCDRTAQAIPWFAGRTGRSQLKIVYGIFSASNGTCLCLFHVAHKILFVVVHWIRNFPPVETFDLKCVVCDVVVFPCQFFSQRSDTTTGFTICG